MGSDGGESVERKSRKPFVYRDNAYIVSSRRDKRVYLKCCLFRKQCKARLVFDLEALKITFSSVPHSHNLKTE